MMIRRHFDLADAMQYLWNLHLQCTHLIEPIDKFLITLAVSRWLPYCRTAVIY